MSNTYQITIKAKTLPDFTEATITVVIVYNITCLVIISKSTSDTD